MLVRLRDWLVVAFLRLIILFSKILPWPWRTRFFGRVIGFIVYLTPNARNRIRKSTEEIYPDWPDDQRRQFTKNNLRHFGQNLIELYNIERFCEELPYFEPFGEGWEFLRAQKAKGEGAICVSGHFGQWEAIRALMASEGMQMAGLFKKNSNPYYEEMFAKALNYSGPMFHTDKRGMAGFVKVLRDGGFVSLLHDQRIKGAPVFSFMGKPANTSTAAAEMALKYDVPLVPFYAIRQSDLRHYHLVAEAPIAPSNPTQMTQELNDSLSRMVEAYPEQWLWLHDRWHLHKPSPRSAKKVEQ